MRWTIGAAVALALGVAVVIVNAPPPDDAAFSGAAIPIADVFAILEAENDAVRALWTKEIVGKGKERGLAFDKRWREPGVEAGPLPALFLRETAESLRRNPLPLYLFLGSDFPISDANKFTGLQETYFQRIKATGDPQFFVDQEVGMQTAMFSDIAVAEACVQCHNADPDTPKTDWRLGDIMGATTWSYPSAEITAQEALALVGALRQSARHAYEEYLAKATTFANPPAVGDRWPSDGYALPTADEFMREVELRASPATLHSLLEHKLVED